ncbi:MAG: 3-dehydroquinate synthase [Planctomycetes bacterium]|nr:3-dehydroquinate synthase [Planctomycetota bacterium]
MPTVHVSIPDRSYSLLIEHGILGRLGEVAGSLGFTSPVLLAADANVLATHARVARTSLEQRGIEPILHVLVAEEKRKNLEAVHRMYDAMLAGRIERRSAVIALGGGVTGDIAGFAAATFMRGVPVLQVPTTLLAMVDAAIGGKTGVNLLRPADDAGRREMAKNLVGAFWQPRAVVVDPAVLDTLDPRHFRCGLAECVKHGMIADPGLLSFIDTNHDGIESHEPAVLTELITRSVRVKVDIVVADEREQGQRALLNLGHTFAHAIEPIEALDLRHGEAVSIGLCAAAACAAATGRFSPVAAQHLEALLRRLGLPTRLSQRVNVDRLVAAMGFDKKVAGGRLRLVLPIGPGQCEIVDDPDLHSVREAWVAVGAHPARAAR